MNDSICVNRFFMEQILIKLKLKYNSFADYEPEIQVLLNEGYEIPSFSKTKF